MSKVLLALGAAALAITVPAHADRDNKGGQSGGKGQAAKSDRGGQPMKAERGNGGGNSLRQIDNGGRGNALRQIDNGGRGNDQARGGAFRKVEDRRHGRNVLARDRRNDDRGNRTSDHDGRVRVGTSTFDNDFSQGRGLRNGCPPGLDKKDNGCLPPGHARKLVGARLQSSFAESLVPYQYRSWYRDDDRHFYRTGDGFMYRVSRDNGLIDGIIPLFGGGYYARGDQWPDAYDFYNVPQQYRNYYADGGAYNYRYGDGAIYRVNTRSGVVDSIVALLAGDLGVGSRLPSGYDAYNVPLSYRDRYYDTADNWYRYNDGYIYQVDPKTRLISAVINALV